GGHRRAAALRVEVAWSLAYRGCGACGHCGVRGLANRDRYGDRSDVAQSVAVRDPDCGWFRARGHRRAHHASAARRSPLTDRGAVCVKLCMSNACRSPIMSRENLRDLLAELHARLQNAPTLDADSRELLTTVSAD